MDAFGFFDAENENEQVLAEAARVLVPGGCVALKVVNGEPILVSFRHTDREERDGVVVTMSRTLSLEPARMIERVLVSGSRGNGQYERRQRLYRADELSAAAKRVGLVTLAIFADANGAMFEPATSPSMWVILQRMHASNPALEPTARGRLGERAASQRARWTGKEHMPYFDEATAVCRCE